MCKIPSFNPFRKIIICLSLSSVVDFCADEEYCWFGLLHGVCILLFATILLCGTLTSTLGAQSGCLLRKSYECSPFFLQHASSIWQISFAPFVMTVQAIAVAFGLHSYGIYTPSHRHIIENAKFDNMYPSFQRNIPAPAPISTEINATFL